MGANGGESGFSAGNLNRTLQFRGSAGSPALVANTKPFWAAGEHLVLSRPLQRGVMASCAYGKLTKVRGQLAPKWAGQ